MANSITGLIHCLQHQLVRMRRIMHSALPIQRQRQQRPLQRHQLHSNSNNKEGTYHSHRLHFGSLSWFSQYFSPTCSKSHIYFICRSSCHMCHTKLSRKHTRTHGNVTQDILVYSRDWLDPNLTNEIQMHTNSNRIGKIN